MKYLSELEEELFSSDADTRALGVSRFYDSFFMNEYGRIEVERAQTHGTSFSVVIIHVENIDREGKEPAKAELVEFLRKLVTTVTDVVRDCDVTGILEDRRIIIILPHTDHFGSLITIKKLTAAVEPLTAGGGPGASIIMSHATYPKDANGFGELLGVATVRLKKRLESPWETMGLREKLFWEIVAELTSVSRALRDYSTFDIGPDYGIDNSLVQRISEGIMQEISRTPEKKGILYIGVKAVTDELPLKKTLSYLPKTATRIFIVGEGKESGEDEGSKTDIKNATVLHLSDPRISSVFFTFFMNEDSAYALICKENWGETHNCFHTSDPYLVEGLITKFQRDYELQERL